MKRLLNIILSFVFMASAFAISFIYVFAEENDFTLLYEDEGEYQTNDYESILMAESSDGMPENAVVLKDIFTDDFVNCSYGGWTLTGNIVDDNVKVGEKSFKVDFNNGGKFGQGAISFAETISGNDTKIKAAIADGYAYVGVWEYIPSGTSWYEIRLNQDNVLRTNERDKWVYVYQPLTEAGNNGRFIYVKNQSVKSYWFDNMQVFMIPPDDTSMSIKEVEYYNKKGDKTDSNNVFINSPVDIVFSQYIIENTANVKLIAMDTQAEIPIDTKYNNNILHITSKTELDYDSDYKIIVSDALNIFGETLEESEIYFKTAKPEFRIEDISYISGGKEIEIGDDISEIKLTATIINDSDEDKEYRLVLAISDGENPLKFAGDSNFVCAANSSNNADIILNDFGVVRIKDFEQIKYLFIADDGIEVSEDKSSEEDVFTENTRILLQGNKLKINAAFNSGKKRKFTAAMMKEAGEGADWTSPGYIICDTTDDEGKFASEVSISQYVASGNYMLYIWGEGVKAPYTSNAYYTGQDKRNEIVSILQNGSTAEISAMLDNADNKIALNAMGIMIDEYESISESKDYIITSVNSSGAADKATEEECVSILNKYIVLAMLKETSDKTALLMNMEGVLEVSERIVESLKNMEAEGRLDCFSEFFGNISYTTISEFNAKLNEITMVSSVNAVKEGDYPSLLKHLTIYSDIVGYDIGKKMSDYNLSEYNKILLLKSLIGTHYTTVGSIKSAIDNGIEKYKPSYSVPSGGSSGGSSGGGAQKVSSGVSYPPAAASVSPVKVTDQTPVFEDIDSVAWAKSSILELSSRGIINGYDDNTFRPANNITRAEFIKILINTLFPDSSSDKSNFTDVPVEHWAYGYISKAHSMGIINGISDEIFAPDENITNEQMAVMCSRAVAKAGIKLEERSAEPFEDFNDVSFYAKMAVINLQNGNIISGDDNGYFYPYLNTTRAQASKIIYNIINEKEKQDESI